jgi:hypothetical protein
MQRGKTLTSPMENSSFRFSSQFPLAFCGTGEEETWTATFAYPPFCTVIVLCLLTVPNLCTELWTPNTQPHQFYTTLY